MGRRPNPIVLELFERGDKLPDSSNRYQHTCKRCGELFPKGRVDGLLNHILRNCQNATEEDRQVVMLHIQQQGPANLDIAKLNKQDVNVSRPLTNPHIPPDNSIFHLNPQHGVAQYQAELPLPALNREQSALDTLAEVSRRHLDYSHSQPHYQQGHAQQQLREDAEDQSLFALQQLNETVNLKDRPMTADAHIPRSGPAFSPMRDVATTTAEDMALIHAASEANQQLEQSPFQDQIERDNFTAHFAPPANEPPVITSETLVGEMSWSPTNMAGMANVGALAASVRGPQGNTGFGILQKPTKGKSARGRFTENRRKEVQEIRKRGACIRCRMLKKPCSEGTPCNTCKNVESARLWKSNCLRTRVADEFTLWSTFLFHTRARQEVPAAVHGMRNQLMPGCLGLSMAGSTNATMSLCVRRYAERVADQDALPIDPDLQIAPQVRSGDIILLDEGEGMVEKVEAYVNATASAIVDNEPDAFLRATLRKAQALVAEDLSHSVEEDDKSATRSCYSIQNMLLKNVTELWIETAFLTTDCMTLMHLRYTVAGATSTEQQGVSVNQPDSHYEAINAQIANGSTSHKLICTQLLAAIEARCAKLSKIVMNELERRLLQRQQVSGFATFLASVILLSCIERMSQLYHDSDASADWPLDDAPSALSEQGDRFSDLLIMLLKMRALPPKTLCNAQGKLEVDKECLGVDDIPRNAARAAQIELTRAAAQWLDPVALDVEEVRRKGGGGGHDWNLRFIAKVLPP